MRLAPRAVFAAFFVTCAGLIGFGLFMQHVMGLEPCPMCILQRYAFVAIGIVGLIAAIHGPALMGQRIYSALLVTFAVLGGGTSLRHSYLQRFPDNSTSCGADLEFLIGNFPLTQAFPKIFAGAGECSKVSWKLFGLSTPEWAFIWFALLAGAAIWAALRKS